MKFESPRLFRVTEHPVVVGEINLDYLFLTEALLEEPRLELQILCTLLVDPPPRATTNGRRPRALGRTRRSSLNIILYGPADLSGPIFDFVQECNDHLDDETKIYLQDPVGCDRNVPYCNPQRLPPLDSSRQDFTFDLAGKLLLPVHTEELQPLPELLELLDSQEDLPEATQPPAISTALKRYVALSASKGLFDVTGPCFTDLSALQDIRSKL